MLEFHLEPDDCSDLCTILNGLNMNRNDRFAAESRFSVVREELVVMLLLEEAIEVDRTMGDGGGKAAPGDSLLAPSMPLNWYCSRYELTYERNMLFRADLCVELSW